LLRCILEIFYELNLDLHLLFIDLKQAYDSINRTYLYEIRETKEISELNENDVAGFKWIQGQLNEAFGIERGLRQGDALSTTLFNTVLKKVKKNIETKPSGINFNKMRHYIACADDVLILGSLVTAIDEVIQILNKLR
jgi:hypothetical protein